MKVGCTNGVGEVADLITKIHQANNNGSEEDGLRLGTNCVYTLTTADRYWYGPTGLPVITSTGTIVGNGATLVRDSSVRITFRFFYVAGSSLKAARVPQSSLRLHGLARGGSSNNNERGGGDGMGAKGSETGGGGCNPTALSGGTNGGHFMEGTEGGTLGMSGSSRFGGDGSGSNGGSFTEDGGNATRAPMWLTMSQIPSMKPQEPSLSKLSKTGSIPSPWRWMITLLSSTLKLPLLMS